MRRHHPLTYTRPNRSPGNIIPVWVALAVGVLLGLGFIWFLGTVLSAPRAYAHSWYPFECCSGTDCSEIAASRVRVSASGYVIDGRFVVPYREVRQSPDGRFHACFPTPDRLLCFFAPPPGT